MNLIYSDEAREDLLRLREFIAAHDPSIANRIARELVERIEAVTRFPLMGHAVQNAPEPDKVRDMVFGKYVVRYIVHKDVVAILRIWHHYEERL